MAQPTSTFAAALRTLWGTYLDMIHDCPRVVAVHLPRVLVAIVVNYASETESEYMRRMLSTLPPLIWAHQLVDPRVVPTSVATRSVHVRVTMSVRLDNVRLECITHPRGSDPCGEYAARRICPINRLLDVTDNDITAAIADMMRWRGGHNVRMLAGKMLEDLVRCVRTIHET